MRKHYYVRLANFARRTVEVVNGVVYVTKTGWQDSSMDGNFVLKRDINQTTTGLHRTTADSYFMMGDNHATTAKGLFWQKYKLWLKKNESVSLR